MLNALEDMEFDQFVDPLKECLAGNIFKLFTQKKKEKGKKHCYQIIPMKVFGVVLSLKAIKCKEQTEFQ